MLSTTYVPGAPNWLDLGVPEVAAAADFYGGVFGWTFQSAGPEAGGYGFFQLDGKAVAAAGPLTEAGATPSWTIYFNTPDADGVAKAVQAAGGTVRVPPADVFTHGRMGAFTDPSGAQFAVWQPGDTGGLEVVMQPNALCWTELYTTDDAQAKDFYRSVFSWQYQAMPTGAGGPEYTVVAPAGASDVAQAAHGGIMQLMQDNLDAGSGSEWHPYFGVEDCDATYANATGRGATELFAPMDVPGVGRMAMVKDPFGAVFALIKGDPTMG